MQYHELSKVAMAYAEYNYSKKGARYDVIVECMSLGDIATEMAEENMVKTEVAARAWADRAARLQHEVELNQAWDGPESCIGSELYDPRYDAKGEF
jgi:hypothetical protein